MKEKETSNEISLDRREMITTSILASAAITAGILGLSTTANAQSNNLSDSTDPKLIPPPRPPKVNPDLITVVKSTYTNEDLEKLKNKIRILLDTNFQITSKPISETSSIDNKNFQRIENFIKIDNVALALLKGISDNFLPTHVEVLLDQAANLLDRGIKDRAEWDDKAIKNINLALELKEFFDLDDIHKEETSKGFYEQQVETLKNQLNIELGNKASLEMINKYFDDMFKLKWTTEMQEAVSEAYASISQLEALKNPDGNTIHDKTKYVVQHNQAIQYVSNFIQDNGYANALGMSNKKIDNLNELLIWETANRDFKLRRTDVTRKYEYLKALATQAEDGILNYNKRLVPLAERFTKDFNDAYARLQVAAIGLNSIYGYKNPLPQYDGSVDFFDKCILWNRDAINFLVRFSRLDQSYVYPISIKNKLDKNIFNYLDSNIQLERNYISKENIAGLWESSIAKGKFEFTLEEGLFENQRNVRVRGVSIFVSMIPYKHMRYMLDKVNGTIMVDLKAPDNSTSYYRHLDEDGQPLPNACQDNIPTLRVGRVSTRDFIRTPEICGTSIFYNVSPFGKWTLTLPQIDKGNLYDMVYIDDIYIDLYLTVRKKKV